MNSITSKWFNKKEQLATVSLLCLNKNSNQLNMFCLEYCQARTLSMQMHENICAEEHRIESEKSHTLCMERLREAGISMSVNLNFVV